MTASDQPGAVERPTIDVATPIGGWPDPWPNVAEIAAVLPSNKWTLVGGLMTQVHSIHRNLGIVRPTNDVDIVLHIETTRGIAAETADALRSLGYSLRPAVDPRDNTAHRYYRGTSKVDLVAGHTGLLQGALDRESTEVGGREALEPAEQAADRGARPGDDDGSGHGVLLQCWRGPDPRAHRRSRRAGPGPAQATPESPRRRGASVGRAVSRSSQPPQVRCRARPRRTTMRP